MYNTMFNWVNMEQLQTIQLKQCLEQADQGYPIQRQTLLGLALRTLATAQNGEVAATRDNIVEWLGSEGQALGYSHQSEPDIAVSVGKEALDSAAPSAGE